MINFISFFIYSLYNLSSSSFLFLSLAFLIYLFSYFSFNLLAIALSLDLSSTTPINFNFYFISTFLLFDIINFILFQRLPSVYDFESLFYITNATNSTIKTITKKLVIVQPNPLYTSNEIESPKIGKTNIISVETKYNTSAIYLDYLTFFNLKVSHLKRRKI